MIAFHRALQSANEYTAPEGTPSVTVVGTKDIATGPDWYGRTSMKIWRGITVLSYRQADTHPDNDFDVICVKFSNDYGDNWTEPNTYLDGTPVTGMPSYPDAGPADPQGAGEPWLYLMPNGDLVIHMWKSNYGVTNSGTYQIRSTDGGRSWSSPALVEFQYNGSTHPNNLNIFATDDDFVFEGVVYAGAREYQAADTFDSAIRSWFLKTEDNGVTWELISLLSAYSDVTNEYGMTYVGGQKIVAYVREFVSIGYRTESNDFGETWDPLVNVTSLYGAMSRQRVNTFAQLELKTNYWNDPRVLVNGYVHVNPGSSHPRRICVWVSKDNGDTLYGPFYLDDAGYDGGYGCVIWNPNRGEFVCTVYKAPIDDTDLNDGIVRQFNFTVTWS